MKVYVTRAGSIINEYNHYHRKRPLKMIFAVLPVVLPLFGCTLLVQTVQPLEIGRTAIFLNISFGTEISKLATQVAVAVSAMFFKVTAQ